MRQMLTALFVACALPGAAQTVLPQIEPETDVPVWGAPEARRAFFEAERARMEEEAARLEAEREALAAARAAPEEEPRAGSLITAPRHDPHWRVYRVLVCPGRPHPERPRAEERIGATTLLRPERPRGPGCRWRDVRRRHRADGLVLRLGPDGLSGRLRLGGPHGRIVIEGR